MRGATSNCVAVEKSLICWLIRSIRSVVAKIYGLIRIEEVAYVLVINVKCDKLH